MFNQEFQVTGFGTNGRREGLTREKPLKDKDASKGRGFRTTKSEETEEDTGGWVKHSRQVVYWVTESVDKGR